MLSAYILELILQGYTVQFSKGHFPGDNPPDKIENVYVYLSFKGFTRRAQFTVAKNTFNDVNVIAALEEVKKTLPQ